MNTIKVSIDTIHKKADQLKREQRKTQGRSRREMSRMELLDEAARSFGLESYKEAIRLAHKAEIGSIDVQSNLAGSEPECNRSINFLPDLGQIMVFADILSNRDIFRAAIKQALDAGDIVLVMAKDGKEKNELASYGARRELDATANTSLIYRWEFSIKWLQSKLEENPSRTITLLISSVHLQSDQDGEQASQVAKITLDSLPMLRKLVNQNAGRCRVVLGSKVLFSTRGEKDWILGGKAGLVDSITVEQIDGTIKAFDFRFHDGVVGWILKYFRLPSHPFG